MVVSSGGPSRPRSNPKTPAPEAIVHQVFGLGVGEFKPYLEKIEFQFPQKRLGSLGLARLLSGSTVPPVAPVPTTA